MSRKKKKQKKNDIKGGDLAEIVALLELYPPLYETAVMVLAGLCALAAIAEQGKARLPRKPKSKKKVAPWVK